MTRSLQTDKDNWQFHLDASREYYALAGIYDAVNTNTAATGHFKRRPKFEPWPVPDVAIKRHRSKTKKRTNRKTLGSIFGASTEPQRHGRPEQQ